MNKVVIISTSIRTNSNSEAMAKSFAEDAKYVPERAISGLQGWIDCFEKASLKKTLFCGGLNGSGEIQENSKLQEAYQMGLEV